MKPSLNEVKVLEMARDLMVGKFSQSLTLDRVRT